MTVLESRENESGVAALEFALVLPILLALVLGVVSVGHGLIVKYVMNSATYTAARVCTMANAPDKQACAQLEVRKRIKAAGGDGWCAPAPVVDAKTRPAAGSLGTMTVNTLTVSATCGYRGIIASYYLSETHGLTFTNITAESVIPY